MSKPRSSEEYFGHPGSGIYPESTIDRVSGSDPQNSIANFVNGAS